MKANFIFIGRAIRHQNDYASLILVDSRYASPRINAKLPKWIGESVMVTKNFGHAVKVVGQFFREKAYREYVSPSASISGIGEPLR